MLPSLSEEQAAAPLLSLCATDLHTEPRIYIIHGAGDVVSLVAAGEELVLVIFKSGAARLIHLSTLCVTAGSSLEASLLLLYCYPLCCLCFPCD